MGILLTVILGHAEKSPEIEQGQIKSSLRKSTKKYFSKYN